MESVPSADTEMPPCTEPGNMSCREPSRLQKTEGDGLPSAEHGNVTELPTGTRMSDGRTVK